MSPGFETEHFRIEVHAWIATGLTVDSRHNGERSHAGPVATEHKPNAEPALAGAPRSALLQKGVPSPIMEPPVTVKQMSS